jgi:hypothetical protein
MGKIKELTNILSNLMSPNNAERKIAEDCFER